jgi:hypothetical protein
MNITDYVSLDMHKHLVWLGKLKGWIRAFVGQTPTDLQDVPLFVGQPNANGPNYVIDGRVLEDAPGVNDHKTVLDFIQESGSKRNTRAIITLDLFAEFFAHGPKFFIPSMEQWESMEHVKVSVPLEDFSSPYGAVSIRIPQNARHELESRCGIKRDHMPRQCLVRWRRIEGEPIGVSVYIGQRFGIEGFYHFMQPLTQGTLEEAIVEKRGDRGKKVFKHNRPGTIADFREVVTGPEIAVEETNDPRTWQCFETITRTSLNLCLMLTQFGHRLNDRNDPARAKSRRERRELEERKTRDFAAIEMKQTITIRQPNGPTANEPGPGTGGEMCPHWRKGHWRAYPGQAKLRAEGKAKLLFVRPCLVRRDRMTGDESESQVTYRG